MTEGHWLQTEPHRLRLTAHAVDFAAHAVELVWSTEPAVGLVDIPYQVSRPLFTDVFGQSATDISGQGQFTIAESPSPSKSTDEITGVTGYATTIPVARRTLATVNVAPLLNEQDIQARGLDQLQGSKDTGRATPNDDNVVFYRHGTLEFTDMVLYATFIFRDVIV
jgi:hypothetical protein